MTKLDVDAYIGKRLKQRRTMLGYTQDVVAKSVGVTFQQVQKYEKGTNAMNASRLLDFSRFMNVPVSYFFEELEAEAVADKKSPSGMAESADAFDHQVGRVSDRESLEMMKAFKRIDAQPVRKRLSDLVRAIADNKTMLD